MNTNSKVLSSVINDLIKREQRGIIKYNTTLDRSDLTDKQWLQHLYEELLDAALYTKKLINKETDLLLAVEHNTEDSNFEILITKDIDEYYLDSLVGNTVKIYYGDEWVEVIPTKIQADSLYKNNTFKLWTD